MGWFSGAPTWGIGLYSDFMSLLVPGLKNRYPVPLAEELTCFQNTNTHTAMGRPIFDCEAPVVLHILYNIIYKEHICIYIYSDKNDATNRTYY